MDVSVIITTFKRPDLLRRAALSVSSQNLDNDVNLKIIISDDDPDSDLSELMSSLNSTKNDNVSFKYIKRTGGEGGVARSRNSALSNADGEWIVFLDDDDILMPDAIASLLSCAEHSNADFVAGSYIRIQENKEGEPLGQQYIRPQWHGYDQLLIQNLFPIGSFAMKKDITATRFNTNLKTHEDWLFLIDNLKDARVAIIDTVVLQVRHCVDQSRSHRNDAGGAWQVATDYARIYALHPASHLINQRRQVLASLSPVQLDELIGGGQVNGMPVFQDTAQGRYLICNRDETIQSSLLRDGKFEPLGALLAIAIVTRKPGTVIDVGANIGVFTVPVARAVPEVKVICIEAQRLVFMHLCSNILVNGLKNVFPRNLAIGKDEPSGRKLRVPVLDPFMEKYTGSVSLDRVVQERRGSIDGVAEPSKWAKEYDQVSVVGLDQICADAGHVAFVKVDVEGMELEVLRSGKNSIIRQRPALFFEAWTLEEFKTQRNELLDFVKGLGYVVIQISEDCLAYHPTVYSAHDIYEILSEIGLDVPKEIHALIKRVDRELHKGNKNVVIGYKTNGGQRTVSESDNHLDDGLSVRKGDVAVGEIEPVRLGTAVIQASEAGQDVSRAEVRKASYAVILHLYYDDLWDEIDDKLVCAGIDFDLYVSLAGPAVALEQRIHERYPSANIFIVPNRGRDIAPRLMLAKLAVSAGHELLLWIHGKKSPHLKDLDSQYLQWSSLWHRDGDQWRRDLLGKLLEEPYLQHILSRFEHEPTVGLIGPIGYWLPVVRDNGCPSLSLLERRMDWLLDSERHGFFAGSMFWVRAQALEPLLDLELATGDFDEESGQVDGTLAHAVERIFSVAADKAGFKVEDSNGGVMQVPHLDNLDAKRNAEDILSDAVWVQNTVQLWAHKPQILLAVVAKDKASILATTRNSLDSQWYQPEIAVVSAQQNTISQINDTFNSAQADWFAVIDNGCTLSSNATFRLAHAISQHPEWQLVYVDEDVIGENDEFKNPHYKPEFNLDYLRSMPYVGSFIVIRRDLFMALGGFDPACEGSEDYDFVLRTWEYLRGTGESGRAIGHVSGVIFHRLTGASHSHKSWPDVLANMAASLKNHLGRLGTDAEIESGILPATFRVRYQHADKPLVSIIVPTRNQRPMLERCLESLFAYTSWPNFEIVIVDNGSDEPDAVQYIEGLRVLGADLGGRIRVVDYSDAFNYSAMNNFAASEARGDYLLLLNNDTAALHADWLDAMMEHAQRPEVGVVGAKLLYPNGKIQHAGVVVGMKGPAEHPFLGCDAGDPGYYARLQVEQDYSAVTGACLLVRKSLYEMVGGLDSCNLAVSYSDVDLCLKIREQGYLVIWTPHAVLLHEGSKSQKSDVEATAQASKLERFMREADFMYRRWLPQMAGDPAYNRYLSLASTEFLPEPDIALQWDPEWRPVPRIVTQPADRMGCGEYRIKAPTRVLIKSKRIQGLESERIYTPPELARIRPDALVLQRQVEPHQIEAIERHKQFNNVFCVFEIDDLVNNVPVKSVHKKLLPKDLYKRLRRAVAVCDRLVVSTESLAEAYRDLNGDIKVIPNFIEDARWGGLSPRRRVGRKPRVGWAGGISHTGDLELIEGVIEALKDEVEWVFFGMCPERLRPYIHEFHAPVPLGQYAQRLAALNLDLAIAPLEDNPFNHAKSSLRLLEYGVLGYPVVCSDLTPYRGDFPVTRVRNRFRDWIEAIRGHLADLDATAAQGDALRDHVRRHWLLENNLDAWLQGWLPDRQK